ncbi:hypothetical protein AWZ03_015107, partial [Drosophila navojoa]
HKIKDLVVERNSHAPARRNRFVAGNWSSSSSPPTTPALGRLSAVRRTLCAGERRRFSTVPGVYCTVILMESG